MEQKALSIIVPLAPEDRPGLQLAEQLQAASGKAEIIVSADAGSVNDLPAWATRVHGPAGRGRQLNRGAQAASGRWLWFVHADCTPARDAFDQVLRFIDSDTPRLGYCWLRFANDGPRLSALNAIGANLRSRLLGLPYGDQGLCLPAACYQRIGGYREDLQRGEDLDLVVRARNAGLPIRPMATTLTTSARRYQQHGWLKTTWSHQLAARRLIRNARREAP